MRQWVLPDSVEDVLPPAAAQMEQARRALLDAFAQHSPSYWLVNPPLVEHLDALLTGTGRDLEASTFKLTDPLSGRMLGVRPDITPQVARIDASYFESDEARRFCYAGEVLRTHAAIGASRALTQVGAELFGVSDVSGDVEIVKLMISAARAVNASPLLIDCGHVGVFKALTAHYALSSRTVAQVDAALAAKSASDIATIKSLSDDAKRVFTQLATLFGPAHKVIAEARTVLPDNAAIRAALTQLEVVCNAIEGSGAQCSVDLADLPGLDYHTGLVFVAYLQDTTHIVARGGRYDGVGETFMQSGRGRPATGFSFIDLRALVEVTSDK
jgi:ATP phosphoribosyltransferase regulatory subunit